MDLPPDSNPYATPVETGGVSGSAPAPASRRRRLLAFFIDGLLIGLLAMVVSVLVLPASGSGLNFGMFVVFNDIDLHTMGIRMAVNLIYIAAYVVLNGLLLARRGQTIGKYATGIAIVGKDGSRVPLAKILLLRVLPFWLINNMPFVSIIILADAVFIFAPGRRCLHDRMAGTQVVTYSTAMTTAEAL